MFKSRFESERAYHMGDRTVTVAASKTAIAGSTPAARAKYFLTRDSVLAYSVIVR